MKKLLLPMLLMASAAVAFAQQPASVPMTTRITVPVTSTNTGNVEADRAHEALWTAWRAKPPTGITRTNRAYWEWQDKVFKQFAADAEAFAKKFPKDVRRWEAIVQSGYTPPWFITGFKPEFDAQPREANIIVDEAAKAAFKEHQIKLNRELMLADDATARQRVGAFGWMFVEERNTAVKAGKQADPSSFEPLMDEVATKLPDERGAELLGLYLNLLRQSAPEKAAAFEAKLDNKPAGKAVKEFAAKQEQARADARAATLRATTDIGTLKFTAADGSQVDFAKLRGKVVLVDFWATWCGPCIKEIPNIVATYDKYHDKGFEIVGITLENSGLVAGDGKEAKDKKLATAKEKMLAFTKKNKMPWPQHFDGLYWQSELAVKYGIRAIPAMFLLDKEGKVVSTEARGPKLESEVKRLLGL